MMKLDHARAYAEETVEWLSPFAEKIEVAGSVRRERPEVGDIDLVCIPKLDLEKDMLGTVMGARNQVIEAVKQYLAKRPDSRWMNGKEPKAGAELLNIVMPWGQLDIFFADAGTWATRLMCRTGSKEHNIWLCERAKRFGAHWNPQKGLSVDGEKCPAWEEMIIYHVLGLPWIPPQKRERDQLEAYDKGRI